MGETVIVVPAQSGRAISVRAGALISVVDVGGHQVGDLWAIDASDHGRWLSVSHTRDRCERLFPAVDEHFRDQNGDPIPRLAADTSPGIHDMLFPPCDPALYEGRGMHGHPNCRDNFLAAAAAAGPSLPVVPDPVNLFQNSRPHSDGRLANGKAASLPGDAI
ncbi:MAG TPA: urea carboxylase-associated family protein, partial [Streptosporangiaceae bacterium]